MPVSPQTTRILLPNSVLERGWAARVFADRISSVIKKRPELDELLNQLRAGEVIVVTKYVPGLQIDPG
jgi:DNA invertase Pin-like site-specific DNA recombinase